MPLKSNPDFPLTRPKKLTIDDCKVTRNGDTIEIHLPFKRTDPRYPWTIEDHELLLAAAKKVNAV